MKEAFMKFEKLISKYSSSLSDTDKYIARCILSNKEELGNMTIDSYSLKYSVSTSALTRFAQRLGLSGYKELRTIIRIDSENDLNNYDEENRIKGCLKSVIYELKNKDFSELFRRMDLANRIIIFGEGEAQSRIVSEMKRIFLPSGLPIFDFYGEDMIKSILENSDRGDLVFLISFDGENKILLDMINLLKAKSIYVVSITDMKANSLSMRCDENIYIASTEISINKSIKFKAVSQYFLMIELLFLKYKLSKIDGQSFKL